MEIEFIKDEARKFANQQEFTPKRDEWHSAYYGYIKGYQDALNVSSTKCEGKADSTSEKDLRVCEVMVAVFDNVSNN